MKNFSPEVISVYKQFTSQVGSEHIVGPVSLSAVYDICKKNNPKTVLEMGGGIGTISFLVLNNSQATIDIYEPNDFCNDALQKNLSNFDERYQIIRDYRQLPPKFDYDLVIVDGGAGSPGDTGYMRAVYLFLLSLNSVKTIYVEGHRTGQRAFIRRALREKYTYKTTSFPDVIINGMKGMGGIRFDCIRTNSRVKKLTCFFYHELKSKMKL